VPDRPFAPSSPLEQLADWIGARFAPLEEMIVALTAAQQQAVNDLSSAIAGMARTLETVIRSAEQANADLARTREDLLAMAAEEGREQAERERLEAAAASMDTDLAAALRPLTDQVKALDASLQNTPKTGGSALQPTGPGTNPTPEAGVLSVDSSEPKPAARKA
jgi:chromosome segregation ATPase